MCIRDRIWPVFGATNQLVAAIALLAMGVWVIRSLKKSAGFIMYPMAFMLVTTIVALVQMIAANLNNYIVSGISTVLQMCIRDRVWACATCARKCLQQ